MSDKIKFIELINHINKIYEVNSYQQMDYIYEIYKTGSFSKAAANLYISQPALSISVKTEQGHWTAIV